jgi:hypothetical protein
VQACDSGGVALGIQGWEAVVVWDRSVVIVGMVLLC